MASNAQPRSAELIKSLRPDFVSRLEWGNGIYAEIYLHAGASAQTIATATTAKSTCWASNGLSSLCTPDQANDKITITRPGIYRVSCVFSVKSNTATNLLAEIFVNGVSQNNLHARTYLGSTTVEYTLQINGLYDSPTFPVDVDLRFTHSDAGNVDVTVTYANLNVQWIAMT